MDKPKYFGLRFAGITLGILAALLIWPATGGILRAHLGYLVPGRTSALVWNAARFGRNVAGGQEAYRQIKATAAQHLDDYQIQLADTLTDPPESGYSRPRMVAKLRALAARFPDHPSVYANTLRFAVDQVMIRRPELVSLLVREPAGNDPAGADPAPEALGAFDRDAARGEQLDPDNAYFPAMRAIELFAAHRDMEALAALHRAGTGTVWNEYYHDEMQGEIRLQELTFGQADVISRTGTVANILFPQYAQIRQMARVAVAEAVLREQAGQRSEGIAIREDVLRCGGLMRAEAGSLIGNLVGVATTRLSILRPDGAPLPPAAPALGSPREAPAEQAQRRAQQIAEYDAFLNRGGHPEQSRRVHAELEAGAQISGMISGSADKMDDILRQQMVWALAVYPLSGAVTLFLIGIVAALAARIPVIRTGRGLSRPAGRGTLFGLLGALLSGALLIPAAAPTPILWLPVIVFFGALATLLPGLNRTEHLKSLRAYTFSLVLSGLVLLLFAGYIGVTLDPVRSAAMAMTEPAEGPATGLSVFFTSGDPAALVYRLITLGVLGLVPVVSAIVFLIISRRNGVPASVGLARGFQGCALPLGCTLILCYVALLPMLVRSEQIQQREFMPLMGHEGRTLAQWAGKTWPGRIP